MPNRTIVALIQESGVIALQAVELNDRSRKLEAANKAEEERRKEEAAKPQLEKEFQRDLPDIKKYLSAFITPGVAHRDVSCHRVA